MKTSHEKDVKNKETELAALKVKIKTLEISQGDSSQRVSEVREELSSKIKSKNLFIHLNTPCPFYLCQVRYLT